MRSILLALAALGLMAGSARAGSEAAIEFAGPGAKIYGERCATGNDHPQGRIPPR